MGGVRGGRVVRERGRCERGKRSKGGGEIFNIYVYTYSLFLVSTALDGTPLK